MARVKRGRDRMRPQGHKDGRDWDDQMSMDRQTTRDVFEANEIVGEPKTFEERKDANREALEELQRGMRPIRKRRR